MSTELTERKVEDKIQKSQKPYFTPEQITLIQNTLLPGCTQDQLMLFLQQCQRTDLCPFNRQIYGFINKVKGQDKLNILTSIDGFRLIAERSGKYAGQVGPFYLNENNAWVDYWIEEGAPRASKVGVLREDFKEPLYAVARYKTYAQGFLDRDTKKFKPNFTWDKMPDVMLSKCAESLALRRAFPHELSGLYTGDEMPETTEEPVKVKNSPKRSEGYKILTNLIKQYGLDKDAFESITGFPDRKTLTEEQISIAVTRINESLGG